MKKKFALPISGVLVAAVMLFLAMRGNADDAPATGRKTVELPEPKIVGGMSVEEAMAKRRSVRAFADQKLTIDQVSQLAWSAQGITDARRRYRTAPSAGALYPLELYIVLPEGVYRYQPVGNTMELTIDRDVRADLSRAALGQIFVADAPVNLVIAAVYERVTGRYGERGRRYVDIEVGHAAQNVHLQAVAMGLGSVPVGAFRDEAVRAVLQLPADHVPLYIIPVGYPRR